MWDIFDGCFGLILADRGLLMPGAMWSACLRIPGGCEFVYRNLSVYTNDSENATEIGTYRVEIIIRSLYTRLWESSDTER